MATMAIPVEQYLATTYRPDRDYVDGVALERNLGEHDHASLQTFLAAWFYQHRQEWQVASLTEQRVQVSRDRYRIPDVCLRSLSDPRDPILWRPPVLCIEILSREDRLTEIRQRVDDYVKMGVEHVWVIDPQCRRTYTCVAGHFSEFNGDTLAIAGTGIHVPLAALWAELEI
jgi:Uma2 family endonuclease